MVIPTTIYILILYPLKITTIIISVTTTNQKNILVMVIITKITTSKFYVSSTTANHFLINSSVLFQIAMITIAKVISIAFISNEHHLISFSPSLSDLHNILTSSILMIVSQVFHRWYSDI